MATPPFLAGPSGAQAPAPVSSPLGGGAAGQPTDQMQQLLKMILSGAQQRPQVAQPTPAPIPPGAPNQPTLVGKHTGPANLGAAIGSTIQNAVHQEKQKKLAAATSDWTDLLTSTQKYMTPDGKVDPKAYQDPAVMQVLGDPKKLKRMAKALNQDWLNPKPDEYADALKIATKQHQDKQGAIQGLKQTMQQMVQHIRGQGQQGQVSPQGAESIMQRAPIGKPQQDPALMKDATSMILENMKEGARAKEDADKASYTQARDDAKERANQFRETQRQQAATNLQNLRDLSAERRQADRDKTMLEGLGIRLSEKDKGKIGGMTPAQINTEYNGTLTSFRQQYTQANRDYLQMQKEIQSKGFWRTAGTKIGLVDDPDVKAAKAQVDSLQSAISFLEKKRGAIVAGKEDMDSVIDQAQKIMNGDLSDLGGKKVQ